MQVVRTRKEEDEDDEGSCCVPGPETGDLKRIKSSSTYTLASTSSLPCTSTSTTLERHGQHTHGIFLSHPILSNPILSHHRNQAQSGAGSPADPGEGRQMRTSEECCGSIHNIPYWRSMSIKSISPAGLSTRNKDWTTATPHHHTMPSTAQYGTVFELCHPSNRIDLVGVVDLEVAAADPEPEEEQVTKARGADPHQYLTGGRLR